MSDDNKPNRKEYMAQYYIKKRAEIVEKRKARQDDINAGLRLRTLTDPNYRAQRKEARTRHYIKRMEKIANDPASKAEHDAHLAQRRQTHKHRMATDPDYRLKQEEYNTKRREKRKEQAQEKTPPHPD